MKPHFPRLPEGYWTGRVNHAALQRFVGDVGGWRERMTTWLTSERARARLSAGLIEFLWWTLGTRAGPAFDPSPYRVSTFPERPLTPAQHLAVEGRTMAADYALDVLVWRALVVDFLADVWDTIGTPLFEVEECAVATQLFMPEDHEDGRNCPYCLQEYDGGDAAGHYATCPIQQNVLTTRWETE